MSGRERRRFLQEALDEKGSPRSWRFATTVADGACAIFAYAANTSLGAPPLFIVVVAYAIIRTRGRLRTDVSRLCIGLALWGTVFAIQLAAADRPVIGGIESRLGSGLPLPFTLLLGVVASAIISHTYLKMLVLLAAIEAITGLIQSATGNRSFFDISNITEQEFGASGFWKNYSVFGFGPSQTNFAVRQLLGLTALIQIQPQVKSRRVVTAAAGLLLAGVAASASRTTFAASIVATTIIVWRLLGQTRLIAYWILAATAVTSVGLLFIFYEQILAFAFLGQIDLSGRERVFEAHLTFFSEHPWEGNLGVKYFASFSDDPDRSYSAHNSYLQLLSTCGIVFTLWILFVIITLGRYRIVNALPLLVASLGNLLIFNGASLVDQAFWGTIFGPSADSSSLSGNKHPRHTSARASHACRCPQD